MSAQPPTGAAPNVLLIHSDQHRFDCVGANQRWCGDGPGRLAETPNLDRLAADGATFAHAYTPIALCTPARASLLTGTWPSRHESWVIPNTLGYRPADPALPNLYRLASHAGYHVAHVGKYHQELMGTPLDHGAAAFHPEEDYDRWRHSRGLPPRPMTNGFFGETDRLIRDGESRISWGATRAIEEIAAARRAGRPFFVRWDPSEPHLPNVVPEPWASRVPPGDVPPWPSFPDPLVGKPFMQRRTRQRWGCNDWTWSDWQPIVARYLGEIMHLDAQIGRLLAALEASGVAGETLVIYSTDHGDFCGGHGMTDKHYCGYDDILRVPLIARWPARIAAGTTSERFLSHELDIARTIASATSPAGPPATFGGRDLLEELAGASAARDDVFSQYSGTQQGRCDQRYLRTTRFKYVYCPVSEDELYDLHADPAELTNVIDRPQYADALLDCRERMTRWMGAVGDKLTGPLWRWPARTRP